MVGFMIGLGRPFHSKTYSYTLRACFYLSRETGGKSGLLRTPLFIEDLLC